MRSIEVHSSDKQRSSSGFMKHDENEKSPTMISCGTWHCFHYELTSLWVNQLVIIWIKSSIFYLNLMEIVTIFRNNNAPYVKKFAPMEHQFAFNNGTVYWLMRKLGHECITELPHFLLCSQFRKLPIHLIITRGYIWVKDI